MHSKSDNIEIMSNNEADENVKIYFDSRKDTYQDKLESMKGCGFVFDYVHYCIINVIKNRVAIDDKYIVLIG